ncbi:zinc finger protein ZFP69-like isoform X2 [Centruroides sculpturatus]|uniref:zinc finger protein ZFP69-like isoform X1 n=1 Tax=Centruroides sculpturatus TaxID=218467 RepID=UPI000C6D7D05|nr:zinc finger protein ZFP69-like isoform X1 [Centruroides sculpturatus]XP_023217958.1 zinc finger protein ZFP69-like isoform X2 [Centruroides sculpturatus]
MEWKVDTFTFDNGISSDLLFGDTPLPSLSLEITHTVFSSFNRTSLDDGLRTPELVIFSADDYSNNCEILNQQLLTDVNPSLQATTHNMIDSPNIDGSLLENQSNVSELVKSDTFHQKEMDISFYSNLDTIPEIPGISSMKSIENNFDTTKSLESLFEIDKEISNLPCMNDIKKDVDNMEMVPVLPEASIIDDDYRLPNDKTGDNVYCSQTCTSQSDLSKDGEINECFHSKRSFKDEINYDINMNSTKDESNELSVINMNYLLTSENSYLSKIDKEIEENGDSENNTSVFLEDNAESMEAIAAAEFAIYQMIEAISDTSQTDTTNDKELTTNNFDATDSKNQEFNSEELMCEEDNAENSNIHVSEISEVNEINHFSGEHIKIESVPHEDDKNNQNEKYEMQPIVEDRELSDLIPNDTELFKITNLECFVSLERLDESFIKNLITSKRNKNSLKNQKSENSTLNVVKMSIKKPKCKVCKRNYSSLASLEIHKCKKRKSPEMHKLNSKISSPTTALINHFECNMCNKSFDEKESLWDHMNIHYNFSSENESSSNTTDEILRNSELDPDSNTLCCQKCKQTFHNYSILIQHLCYMHSNHFRQCEFCKYRFKGGGNIMNHMSHHINHKIYNCDSFRSDFHEQPETHILKCHTSVNKEHDSEDNTVELKPCSVQLEILDLKMS